MNGELALLGWAFGVASGLFAIFCVVAAVRLSRRSFPDLGHHLSDRERGGGVVPRVARPERRGTPPLDKWMLIAQGMRARIR